MSRRALRPALRATATAPPLTAALVSAMVGVALVLTGCAGLSGIPASVALTEQPGFPADAPIGEPLFDESWSGEPVGWLADDRATITIVSYGSSSCPFLATGLEVVDDATVAIELRQAPAQACTDDLGPRTHVLATPEGWGQADGPYTAAITRALDAFGRAEPVVDTITVWPWPEPATIAEQTLRGVPDGVTLPADALDKGSPLAFWSPERQSLRIITWGSSSCPPPAISLTVVDAAQLALVFGPLPPGRACTADFAPTTHVLAVPDGVGPDAVTLDVRIEQRGGSAQQFRIPISD